MTALSSQILSDYQIRKTKKQKTQFIERMQREYPEMKVETGGLMKSRNLVIGDIERARVVFGAHYDTCAVLPFPNFITPKNFLFSILYAVLIALPFLLAMLVSELLLLFLTDNTLISLWGSLVVFFGLYFYVLIGGIPNKHTVNDNTSGVVTLIELMARCREEGISDAAFVFFDHEETGLQGSSLFARMHKKEMKGKLLVNFDCVSDGDHMLFVVNRSAKKTYFEALQRALPESEKITPYLENASTTFYPSDQMNFKVSVAVSALKRARVLGLYLDRIHTKKDTVMEEENIAYLTDMMLSFLKNN